MTNIDFLPIEYRTKHERRQSQPWVIVVGAAMVGLVLIAATMQQVRRHAVQIDQAAVAPAYDMAVQLKNRLAETQKRLANAEAAAMLYTYLRHPWPRSQILSAIVEPLPDSIALEKIQIANQLVGAGQPRPTTKASDKKAEEERRKTLSLPQRDLVKLQDEIDPLRTVVVLEGEVAESAVLHRYLSKLDSLDFFEKAELDYLSSSDDGREGKMLRFRAVLTVQPGYGQPDGPKGKPGIAQTGKSKG